MSVAHGQSATHNYVQIHIKTESHFACVAFVQSRHSIYGLGYATHVTFYRRIRCPVGQFKNCGTHLMCRIVENDHGSTENRPVISVRAMRQQCASVRLRDGGCLRAAGIAIERLTVGAPGREKLRNFSLLNLQRARRTAPGLSPWQNPKLFVQPMWPNTPSGSCRRPAALLTEADLFSRGRA